MRYGQNIESILNHDDCEKKRCEEPVYNKDEGDMSCKGGVGVIGGQLLKKRCFQYTVSHEMITQAVGPLDPPNITIFGKWIGYR